MMAAVQITDSVWSVGVLNPNMRVFDIVMPTAYGTSYNAYLVRGAEKTALIETVHLDFWEDYLDNIRAVCPADQIDYLILNHNEPDHSGAVEQLSRLLPHVKILVSQAGSIYLKNITNRTDLNVSVVKDGDTLDLGGGQVLRFVNAPFLHWPDSMFTWFAREKVLFSCDFLGAHFCEPRMLDSRMRDCDRDGYFEAMAGYYDAIFGPFKPYVVKGLDRLEQLDPDCVCTSHGPVLTRGCLLPEIRKFYREESTPKAREGKLIPIFYTSAYHNTEKLAEAIAEGVREALPAADVETYNIIENDMTELAGLLNGCDAFLLGSPTINRDAVPPSWDLLAHVDAVNFAKRPVALFGSYGWSGEAFANLRARLCGLKADVWPDDLKVVFTPSKDDLDRAREFGKAFAESL